MTAALFKGLAAGEYTINGRLARQVWSGSEGRSETTYEGVIRFKMDVFPPSGRRRPYELRHIYITNYNWAEYNLHHDGSDEYNCLLAEDYEFHYDPATVQAVLPVVIFEKDYLSPAPPQIQHAAYELILTHKLKNDKDDEEYF